MGSWRHVFLAAPDGAPRSNHIQFRHRHRTKIVHLPDSSFVVSPHWRSHTFRLSSVEALLGRKHVKTADSYAQACAEWTWDIPERFNMGVSVCDVQNQSATALIVPQQDGGQR
ncbi:MAG: hypothetical protein ACJAVZ_005311, partial [Afipia broomeae]